MRANIEVSLPEIVSAEKSVIGSAIISSIALDVVCDKLVAEDFYNSYHSEIFKIIKDMSQKNKPVDLITLTDQINLLGKQDLDETLFNIVEYSVNNESIEHYCDLIIEKSIARKLIYAANDIDRKCREADNVLEMAEYAESVVVKAIERKDASKVSTASDMMSVTLAEIDRMTRGERIGVTSGFEKLDRCLGGFDKGDFIVLGGRPSMGKTSLLLNMAIKQAVVDRIPTFIFSIEMPEMALGQRLISAESGIPLFNIRFGRMNRDQRVLVAESSGRIANSPLYIDDIGSLNESRMRSVLRRAKRQLGIELCYIDHLHLMDYKGEDPVHGTTKNSRAIKMIARDLKIPVCALAQLHRLKENHGKKSIYKPTLSDLRQSGAIEQDADVVMFVHRDFVYSKKEEDKFDADIIVAKQRNGPVGEIKIRWDAAHTKFYEDDSVQEESQW